MSKKAWVTGGGGFIGSHLVDRLVRENYDEVIVVDDFSSGDPKNLAASHGLVRLYAEDFASERMLKLLAEEKPDVVFHLAARPRVAYSVEHPAETNEVNVQKSLGLLEACRAAHVRRFVFSSSSSVYGGAGVLPTPETYPKDPKSPYALQKSVIEDYCRMFSSLYDMDTVCLRYFNVFGPRAKGDGAYATAVSAWISAIKSGKPARSDGDGTQSRDMCYVANVVDANIRAARSVYKFCGEKFNVACQDKVTNNEILDFLKKRFEFTIVRAPERQGDVKHTCADITRAKMILGYFPMIRFWDGLEMTLEAEGLK